MKILHPSVYVFIGKPELSSSITESAMISHPPKGVFFLQLNKFEETDIIVREVKTNIQLGESGLNIKRVNVYVITSAESDAGLVLACGNRLKQLFYEDFASCLITLGVLLDESNNGDGFEERCRNTYNFLNKISSSTDTYDRHFLLSNRNEYDVVSPENNKDICELLAYLPLISQAQTYFDEILTAKTRESGKVRFASAGISKTFCEPEEITQSGNAKKVLTQVARCLEQNLSESARAEIKDNDLNNYNEITEKIKSHLLSTAARPCNTLQGLNIEEAEHTLFGTEMAKIYEHNYKIAPKEPMPPTPITTTLTQAAVEEKRINIKIKYLTNQIAQLSNRLDEIKETKCQIKTTSKISAFITQLIPSSAEILPSYDEIDNIVEIICEKYAVIQLLEQMEAENTILTQKHEQLVSYMAHIKDIINTIKNLPEPPKTLAKTPDELEAETAINISLLRDDGLVREKFFIEDNNNPCIIKMIGGFAINDLTRYQVMQEFGVKALESRQA